MKVRGRTVFSKLLLVFLVLALGTLAPLAHASSPDPSWISGIYDGADYDDVVFLITSEASDVTPSLLPELRQSVAEILSHASACVPTAPVSTLHSRAPPA